MLVDAGSLARIKTPLFTQTSVVLFGLLFVSNKGSSQVTFRHFLLLEAFSGYFSGETNDVLASIYNQGSKKHPNCTGYFVNVIIKFTYWNRGLYFSKWNHISVICSFSEFISIKRWCVGFYIQSRLNIGHKLCRVIRKNLRNWILFSSFIKTHFSLFYAFPGSVSSNWWCVSYCIQSKLKKWYKLYREIRKNLWNRILFLIL